MKLVITWTHGDGCTWHADETVPIEYESEEAFAVEFEEACRKQNGRGTFIFAGHSWWRDQFFGKNTYYPPEVQTLEKWFEDHKTTLG